MLQSISEWIQVTVIDQTGWGAWKRIRIHVQQESDRESENVQGDTCNVILNWECSDDDESTRCDIPVKNIDIF